ncbi:hypothetical protein [Rhodococcus qingshengii]|uniref:hypothetical protein n=1 Tax=Rhodococcus qingshengii TaxID=334542 RepID=UPI00071C4593|nr:hypothetical protein [Rhodococcus qingshengii]KSU80768.1 hypothetical protein AS032_08270 [Rhodococcus qingshengii]SCC11055.1 hypothetical protein GA0061093_103427 [Rhodococcus qingshengii]
MTDKELGTAAGDIFAKAFTLGYKTGRTYIPAGGMALTAEQVALQSRVLGAIREFDGPASDLTAALALFPATEPAEDSVGDPLQAWKDFLKPKPIGWYRTMALDFAAKHFGFPANPVFEDRYTAPDGGKWQWTDELQWELRCYPPAPAVPAEVETKAEYPRTDGDFTVLGPEIFTDASGEFICWKGVNYVRQPDPASSPVVPAPTETGPWPTVKSDG